MSRPALRFVGYMFYLLFVVSVLLEIILRFYNPINPRLKGDKIVLPVRQRYEVQIDGLPGVKTRAIHTKNSLGFRGSEPPDDWSRHLTIIAIGGSTTECFFLPDGTDWPALLEHQLRPALPAVWVNNAGLNGHSTFGHQILLDDHVAKLRPKVALFLIGINDVGHDALTGFDGAFLKNKATLMGDSRWRDLARTLVKYSEVAGLIRTVAQGIKTRRMHFRDNVQVRLNPADTLIIPTAKIEDELADYGYRLEAYRQRLVGLLTSCRRAGIEPIFITQPILLGAGIDLVTGTDLAKFRVRAGENGALYARRLEIYNQTTRAVATCSGTHLIDLARLMPKSSAYFYDEMHYTEAGAMRVADLLAQDLRTYLKTRYGGGTTGTATIQP